MTRTDLINMQRGIIKAYQEQIVISEARLADVKEQLNELEPLESHAKVLREVKEMHEGIILNSHKLIRTTEVNNDLIERYMATKN